MERRELEFLGVLAYFTEAKNIVEVGVQFGDAAVHLATSAKKNNGKYVGFDVWSQHGQVGQFNQMSSKAEVTKKLTAAGTLPHFELIQIDTINNKEGFEKELDRVFPDGIDFAFIDGDHSYLGITNDFIAIYPRLSPKGVIVFHDTAVIDGCREFVFDLRTKYNDGTFDIIDLPYGSAERHCGLSMLVKNSYPVESIAIDEICGSVHTPAEIEDLENKHFVTNQTEILKNFTPIDLNSIKMKLDKIGHYPGRKKYE